MSIRSKRRLINHCSITDTLRPSLPNHVPLSPFRQGLPPTPPLQRRSNYRDLPAKCHPRRVTPSKDYIQGIREVGAELCYDNLLSLKVKKKDRVNTDPKGLSLGDTNALRFEI